MRFLTKTALLALVMTAQPGLAAPNEAPNAASTALAGEWRNTRNTVHLRIAPCGKAACGTVIWADETSQENARKGSGREVVGAQLFRNIRPSADGSWKGIAYLPDRNMNASATVKMVNRDQLQVSGCVMFGLACRTQHWWRIK